MSEKLHSQNCFDFQNLIVHNFTLKMNQWLKLILPLEELNQLPKYIIDQKMELFLKHKKPNKLEAHNLSNIFINYSTANTEIYCKNLVSHFKHSYPDFYIA